MAELRRLWEEQQPAHGTPAHHTLAIQRAGTPPTSGTHLRPIRPADYRPPTLAPLDHANGT